MNLIGISEIQKPIESLATIHTKRLWVILRVWELFVLDVNTSPWYNKITSFLNTTLSQDINEDFNSEQLQQKASHLIQTRTWYTNTHYSFTLDWSIERHFHKPDKEYNEIGLYNKTILVFDILWEGNKIDIDPQSYREITYCTNDELVGMLQPNGQNGSSYLMKQLYDLQTK